MCLLPRRPLFRLQFENMHDILKDVASERFEGVAPRTHVNVHLINVPREQARALHDVHTRGTSPVILSGLFEHEHLVSLLHFEVKRYSQLTDDDVVAGKDAYVFHCGFRRFVGKPLFSQRSPGSDKQRVDKYGSSQFSSSCMCCLYAREFNHLLV